MRYRAKPVIVHAFRILAIRQLSTVDPSSLVLSLEDNQTVHATPEMTARMKPVVGDYWVLQADGYVYLNPKDVFERKYEPIGSEPLPKYTRGVCRGSFALNSACGHCERCDWELKQMASAVVTR